MGMSLGLTNKQYHCLKVFRADKGIMPSQLMIQKFLDFGMIRRVYLSKKSYYITDAGLKALRKYEVRI